MITKQWAAIHRQAPRPLRNPGRPAQPASARPEKVLWQGAELYRSACKDQSIMDKFGHGTPDDWLENNICTPRNGRGIF